MARKGNQARTSSFGSLSLPIPRRPRSDSIQSSASSGAARANSKAVKPDIVERKDGERKDKNKWEARLKDHVMKPETAEKKDGDRRDKLEARLKDQVVKPDTAEKKDGEKNDKDQLEGLSKHELIKRIRALEAAGATAQSVGSPTLARVRSWEMNQLLDERERTVRERCKREDAEQERQRVRAHLQMLIQWEGRVAELEEELQSMRSNALEIEQQWQQAARQKDMQIQELQRQLEDLQVQGDTGQANGTTQVLSASFGKPRSRMADLEQKVKQDHKEFGHAASYASKLLSSLEEARRELASKKTKMDAQRRSYSASRV